MKIIRDQGWGFIGIVTGIILTIAVVLYQRQVNELQVEIVSNSSLINVDSEIASDIEIIYKDQPVETLSLILIRLENTGNVAIKESDYSQPIVISISPDAEIGEFVVAETSPRGINLSLGKIGTHQVELSKSLCNPGDQALIRIMALNNDDTLDITARIVDISQL